MDSVREASMLRFLIAAFVIPAVILWRHIMLQSILDNIEAVLAIVAAIWAVREKLKGMNLSKALKFMVSWTDHLNAKTESAMTAAPLTPDGAKMEIEKLKSALAVAQESARVRETVLPVIREVRKERLDSKDFTIGVDIDEKGRPTAKAAFGWRF